MYEEDKCENCWWLFGVPCRCNHPANRWKEPDDRTPCGWFEEKVHHTEPDDYEEYMKEWN